MAIYPGATPSDTNLYLAKNNLATTLNGAINNSVTTIPVTSTTGFPAVGFITIDLEAISYTSVDATNFLGCTRGADGTTAASHLNAAQVFHNVIAIHHNSLKDEIIAIAADLRGIFSSITPVTAADTSTSVLQRIAHIVSQIKTGFGLTNWYDSPPVTQNAFQNYLINGGMEIWQRNTTFSSPASLAYTADRWAVQYGGSGTFTVSRDTGVETSGGNNVRSTYAMKIVVSTVNTLDSMRVRQTVEQLDGFGTGSVTVTAKVKTSVAGKVSIAITGGAQTGNSAYHSGSGNYETLTATIATVNSGTQLRVFIGFNDFAPTATTFYIDNCMMTYGTVGIPFVTADPQVELARCQRYYEIGYAPGTVPGSNVGSAAAAPAVQTSTNRTVSGYWMFKVPKRANPTVRTWTLTGTLSSVDWIDTGGTSHVVASDVAVADTHGLNLRQTTSATYVYVNFGFDADSEL